MKISEISENEEKKKNIRKGKQILVRNIDEKQENTLVVLISWSNAKRRQLLKYSELYETEGYTTILALCKVYRLALFYKSLFQNDTKKVIDVIQEQLSINKERKVVFHLFSAPGPAMFVNIMNYFHQYIPNEFGMNEYSKGLEEATPNIIGVIYDSCLVTMISSKEWGEGVKGTVQNRFLRTLFKYAGRALYRYNQRNQSMWRLWDAANRDVPGGYAQLFLSSKIDYLLNHEKVITFVEYRRSKGEDIGYHIWEDSEHVLHLQKYPDEYKELVTKFCVDISN